MLDLRVLPPDHPDAVVLNDEVQAFYGVIYGGADLTPMPPEQFRTPHGLYLVGYDAGRPVVSGAWRALTDIAEDALADGDAEIKRMYVVPDARGRGHARALLAELERTAAAAGRVRMVLETGIAQPEAIALYRSSGYRPMPVFGRHVSDPRSRCFAKELATPERVSDAS